MTPYDNPQARKVRVEPTLQIQSGLLILRHASITRGQLIGRNWIGGSGHEIQSRQASVAVVVTKKPFQKQEDDEKVHSGERGAPMRLRK